VYFFINLKIRPPARPPPRPPAPANGKEEGSVTNVPQKKQLPKANKRTKRKRKQKKEKEVRWVTDLPNGFFSIG
jgi:hypothetical protein